MLVLVNNSITRKDLGMYDIDKSRKKKNTIAKIAKIIYL